MTIIRRKPCRGLRFMTQVVSCFTLVLLLGLVQTVAAQDGTGYTKVGGCMDDLFPGDLGCTANDVRVSGVADVTGDGIVDQNDITFAAFCDAGASNAGDPCGDNPDVCRDSDDNAAPELCGDRCAFPGDTTTFTATFIVELSAQERYDIGLYFGIDSDPNGDGALTGECSVSTLPEVGSFTRPDGTNGSFVDLDATCKGGACPQPGDLCGDINNDNNPIYYELSITTACVDLDGNGRLNLPSCTSWRQSGANELCTSPLQAFPGAPSKCNCDPAFEVPIDIPPASLKVVKTADPSKVNEPGGTIHFNVSVTNTGIDPNNNVTLNTLSDDIYGDITQVQGDILSTTCLVPQPISPGGTYACSFDAKVNGAGNTSHFDIVTAQGMDDRGNPLEGFDEAKVDILDVKPAISVVKTASPTSVTEPGGDVTFTVKVMNDSTVDALTIISLTDDIHGDLTDSCHDELGLSLVGQSILPGRSVTCMFTVFVDGAELTSETDTVTVVGVDDEFVSDDTTPGNKVSAEDSATVNINDDVAMIELIKTANPTSVNETGDDVTFTFKVTNLSQVDTVTINNLTDTIYGDLNGQGTCTVPQGLAPGGSYICEITVLVEGDAGVVETNVATASGVDDDGKLVMASDDATVTINDVPPAASLTKTATMVVATYEVVVTNDSGVESLDLTALSDDQFGDVTQLQGDVLSTDCVLPQTIPVGDSYRCSFDARVDTSPHTNTVTGTVTDNEGGSVTPSDSATVTFE